MQTDQGRLLCRIGSHSIPISDRILADHPLLAGAAGQTVAVGVRPDAISVTPGGGDGLAGTVAVCEELGSEVLLHIDVEATPARHESVVDGLADEAAGSAPSGIAAAAGRTIVVARLPGDTSVARGTPVSLTFAADLLHFFSLQDGSALRARSAAGPLSSAGTAADREPAWPPPDAPLASAP